MTPSFAVMLVTVAVAVVGGLAARYAAWHAGSDASPEPAHRRPWHRALALGNLAVLAAVGWGFHARCWDAACLEGWFALLVVAILIASLPLWLGRQCKVRQRAHRWHGPWGVGAAVLAMAPFLPGCSFVHKGDLTAWGLLTEIDAEVTNADGSSIKAKKSSQTEFARQIVGEAVRAGVGR